MDEFDAGLGKRRYVLCTPTPETLLLLPLDERTTILKFYLRHVSAFLPGGARAGAGWHTS
jgi:hypothetical protein